MKGSLDPFEVAFNESETPPDSPIPSPPKEEVLKDPKMKVSSPTNSDDEGAAQPHIAASTGAAKAKDEDDEEEENMEVELGKFQDVDPDKMAKMQAILSQFTPEQMSRYESFRRSGFQKSNMRKMLQSLAGCPVSMPMTIVMSGIAKMFVGELVETGRIVMTERNETGPIRPCHIREAYRRLKLEGKVPKRSRPRLFH